VNELVQDQQNKYFGAERCLKGELRKKLKFPDLQAWSSNLAREDIKFAFNRRREFLIKFFGSTAELSYLVCDLHSTHQPNIDKRHTAPLVFISDDNLC
jgi:hypothetical protein